MPGARAPTLHLDLACRHAVLASIAADTGRPNLRRRSAGTDTRCRRTGRLAKLARWPSRCKLARKALAGTPKATALPPRRSKRRRWSGFCRIWRGISRVRYWEIAAAVGVGFDVYRRIGVGEAGRGGARAGEGFRAHPCCQDLSPCPDCRGLRPAPDAFHLAAQPSLAAALYPHRAQANKDAARAPTELYRWQRTRLR
ncbi:MAG: hypothetical protein QOH05_206 [Acetobacteraceae bacterium]|nr:hypothetical protein [Acetobacteraceae bacterium]